VELAEAFMEEESKELMKSGGFLEGAC